MGAWGHLPFDNDTACDWAYGLEDVDDLSLVEGAFERLEEVGDEYLDQDFACEALAACEVLARLQGRPGYHNAYTETVDRWVAAHPCTPPQTLLVRAAAAIDRVLGNDSELKQLWEEGDEAGQWLKAVEDLRARVSGRGASR